MNHDQAFICAGPDSRSPMAVGGQVVTLGIVYGVDQEMNFTLDELTERFKAQAILSNGAHLVTLEVHS